MLILRRKVGDSLQIGENVTITVLSVDASGNINLGIDAPKDVLILRKELEQAKAANTDSLTATTPKAVQALELALPSFAKGESVQKTVKPIAPNAKPNRKE